MRFIAEIDVFTDREVGQKRLFLEHHANALPVGIGGVFKTGRLAGDLDLAGVGLIDSAQDFHQRRFSGPVLTHQSNNFTAPDFKRHFLKRMNAGETLVDVDNREG